MQEVIKIFFNRDCNFSDISITLNSVDVVYTRYDDFLLIISPEHKGVNILRIKLKNTAERLEIVDVKINDSSLRMCLYLSYIDKNGVKSQPDTILNDTDQIWTLPYGSPVSFWLSLTPKKFRNSEFGKNLYERYDIYYPEPHVISDTFPKLIQDYFSYDFDFTVVDKRTATWKDIPYLPLLVSPDPTDAYKEIVGKLEYFYNNKAIPGQLAYNQMDNQSLDPDHWAVWWFGRTQNYLDDLADLPYFKQFLIDLNIKGNVVTGFLAFTKPGSFASPHVDDIFLDNADYLKISGCAQLYIPISPCPDKAEIKLAGVGLLPRKPLVFNNDRFVHGVYNDSAQLRIYLSLRVDPELNSHLFEKPL